MFWFWLIWWVLFAYAIYHNIKRLIFGTPKDEFCRKRFKQEEPVWEERIRELR